MTAAEACCMDCGLGYDDFALDLLLSDDQWLAIHPGRDGLLCARCIVARAAALPGAIVVRAWIETTENRKIGDSVKLSGCLSRERHDSK